MKKVNYVAEAARIGQTTDYDKLTIEVWTNGAVTPRDAVSLAAKLVRDHFTIFVGLNEVGDQVLDPGAEQARSMNANLDKSVEELELSVRPYNCLKNANIKTLRELVQERSARRWTPGRTRTASSWTSAVAASRSTMRRSSRSTAGSGKHA